MASSVREVTLGEQNRLSVLTFWLKDVESLRIPRVWKSQSQPAKLLALGVVIMTCLCGSIYYATARSSSHASVHVALPK